MTDNEVLYQVEGHVATITLNRPDRLNAITRTMLDSLGASLLQANQDSQVRAVVLTGAGKAFCVGLDIQDALTGNSIGSEQSNITVQVDLDLRKAPPTVLHHMDKPTICLLNGSAAGYGMDLELGLADKGFSNDEEKHKAMGIVDDICSNAPLAVQSAKRLMRMGLSEGFNDHVHHVFLQFLQLARTQDFKEGMRSFMEKRPARFIGQ